MTAAIEQAAKVRAEPSVPRWSMPTAVVAGIVFRVVQYTWDRSFWHDEASLVLNIRNKTAAQLLGPLDYHQAAPPLFLLLERGFCQMFGGSELSLRLLPLLLACVSVVLYAVVARRLLPDWAAVATVLLFACSSRLIWHAVEAKQYGVDVFAATVLLALIIPPPDRNVSATRFLAFCGASAALVWLSYPAILVFGGISLALLPRFLKAGPRAMAAYVCGGAVVAASFLGLLVLSVRAQHSGTLDDYWAEDFIDLRRPLGVPVWLARRILALCNYPIEGLGPVMLLAAVAGIAWMIANSRQVIAILLLPLAMNLVAAAARRYPFDGARLTVYLAPMVLLLVGGGFVWSCRWLYDRFGKASLLPAAAIVAWAGSVALFHLFVPQWRGHVRPIARFVRTNCEPGDPIYALELREFQCYWGFDARVSDEIPAADEIPSRRFWIVWSFPNQRSFHRLDGTLAWAKTFATLRLSDIGPGAAAFLFEMDHPPPHLLPPDMSTHHKMMSRERE